MTLNLSQWRGGKSKLLIRTEIQRNENAVFQRISSCKLFSIYGVPWDKQGLGIGNFPTVHHKIYLLLQVSDGHGSLLEEEDLI